MRKESLTLWQQAQHDLDTAQKLLQIEVYYASVFFAEQAAEKALKALYLEKKRRREFTHDLTELTGELGAPQNVLEAAAELSPDYVISRYPDAANALPANLYTAQSAQMHLTYAIEVLEWVKKELKLET